MKKTMRGAGNKEAEEKAEAQQIRSEEKMKKMKGEEKGIVEEKKGQK
jgi:hypothetical protein